MRLNICIISFLLIGLIAFSLFYQETSRLVTLTKIQQYATSYQETVAAHPFISAIGFILLFSLCIAVGLPVVIPFGLLAGFLFGTPLGLVYTLAGSVLGAVGAFFIYRYFFSHWIEDKYRTKLAPYVSRVKADGVTYLLMLQFLGIFPFFIITIVSVLAHVSPKTVAWTTAIGSFPFALASVLAGSKLLTISSTNDLFSPSILMLMGFCILLALAPIVIRYFKQHHYLKE